ncbi:MAG: hypothetical protein KF755_08785 [Burkholderiaceae bacterium]|nr:hypothetical protein [Burkholderiaceae bacterium]
MNRFERWWMGLAVALACAIATPGAAAADANTRVHWRLAEPVQVPVPTPRKVLLLDPRIEVHELSAGGVTQKVPQLTREASDHFDRALRGVLATRADVVAVPLPALAETEQDELDDTIATFNVVAGEAFAHTQPGLVGWEDRAARFDYTLGFGLPWLQARTGADVLLVTYGVDYQSTGGRKAMAVMGALVGVGLPTGFARLRCALIDLATGDILWLHSEGTGTGNLTDAETMRGIVEKTLATLPPLAPKP